MSFTVVLNKTDNIFPKQERLDLIGNFYKIPKAKTKMLIYNIANKSAIFEVAINFVLDDKVKQFTTTHLPKPGSERRININRPYYYLNGPYDTDLSIDFNKEDTTNYFYMVLRDEEEVSLTIDFE